MGGAIVAKLAISAFAKAVLAFAINIVISSVISKVFAPKAPSSSTDAQPNPGAGQQLPPAGSNKLPVIYGTAFTGGAIIDTSITNDNHTIYWVFALCEVTGSENGGTGDNISFGKMYWGGKLCIFDATDLTKVVALKDESTNIEEDVTGFINIYTYKNGSANPANSTLNAINVMSDPNLIYQWNSTKLMTNCAFAIVKLKYSAKRNLTGLSQTRFQVINSRTNTGDCIYDYLTSARYGAAIPTTQVDTDSLNALTTYSNEIIAYTNYNGVTSYLPRFKFNGILDTNQKIMSNIQSMADCCDCLIKYDEVTSKWGVIVQTPVYTVAMAIDDSNITGAITVSPVDLSNSFNYIEIKFPDGSEKDSFNSANFDLAEIAPELLFPNEPVNKQSVSLYLTNNDVTAQIIANRMLKAAREDLQVQCTINFTGLQLEAGDIITLTNTNYGWDEKLFRVIKVTQKFTDEGQITTALNLCEFNPSIYDDVNVTQFQPLNNTGLGDPTFFGSVPAPTVTGIFPNVANPAFSVIATTASAGVTQYAEIWYSAFEYPTESQRIFAGITEVQAGNAPYQTNTVMPAVQLFNIPAGDWYFFTRMVNSLANSSYSPASLVLNWRPTTFQFDSQYIGVAYADTISGGGFSLSPTNKSYYGLSNQSSTTVSTTPSDYKWYLADPAFGTNIYLVYINYQNRKFGFDTDFATYAGGSGAFVPSTANKFDIRLWSALDPTSLSPNIIDLDKATGQVIQTGSTTSNANGGQIAINNTSDGKLIAALDVFLPQIAEGTYLTGSAATITVDRFGRVVGFSTPDNFYYSQQDFTATSGQTVFTPTARVAGYITGQDLILKNGLLLTPTSDYTETSTTFTLNVGATVGDIVSVISMRAVSSVNYYEPLSLIVQSTSTNTAVWTSSQMPYQLINVGDKLTFSNTGTPTQYTVTGVNYTTRTITFSTNPTATAGDSIYRYRASGSSYPVFSRYVFTLTSAGSYTPTTWAIQSGYELIFLNGTIVNEQDYDLVAGAVTNFPATTTGQMTFIQFAGNNLNVPIGNIANVVRFTENGTAIYSFNYDASSFNLYANGCLYKVGSDYTTGTNNYTLTPTPNNSSTVLVQQTFASSGAA